MIEETATVVEKDGYYVWVETGAKSGCGSCSVQGNCGTSLLAGLFKPSRRRIRVFDPYDLQVGEEAVLGLMPHELMKAAFLAYMLPLLMMIGFGAMASDEGFGDLAVMMVSGISLFIGLLLVRLISGRLSGGLAQMRLLRRANEDTEHTLQFINL